MASRADDRTAKDLRQRFLRLHSVDHEDLWHLPADVSDGSDALSGATYDLQRQNDLANEPAGGSSHRKRSSQKRRSPTEEEVPYTAADRLVAQRRSPSFPVGTKVRIYEANSDCLVNAEVMRQNEDDGSIFVEYKVGDRYYGKSVYPDDRETFSRQQWREPNRLITTTRPVAIRFHLRVFI